MADQSFNPFGVIDIGSNSVRLVLFDGIKRAPASFFNEKVLCGLGRDIATTGKLHPEGRKEALEALGRFRVICEKSGIRNNSLECFATAAVREAADGADFIGEVSNVLGHTVQVLSGEEEALLAAEGVLSGIPDMSGWVADLGGGSLELAVVNDGKISHTVSHPFGPLRLASLHRKTLKPMLQEAFATFPSGNGSGTLCLVGGAWRNIARAHMAQNKYPIRVLHHYSMSAAEAREFANMFSKQSARSLLDVEEISARRVETIPIAALVLRELIDALKPDEIVISAHGVREGIIHDKLDPDVRKRDPLSEGAAALAKRRAFDPEIGIEVADFATDFFSDDEVFPPRLVEAASRLSDIAWRDHPYYRRANILHAVLYAPLDGLTHRDRIRIALSLYYRYSGESSSDVKAIVKVVGQEEQQKAKVVGSLMRFAHVLVGQSPGILPTCKLAQDEGEIVLSVSLGMSGLVGEAALARLQALGDLMGKSVRVEVRDYL